MKKIYVLFLAALLAGCTPFPEMENPICRHSQVNLLIEGKHIVAKVACSQAEKEHGLKHTQLLPENHGMLFAFNRPQLLAFWMKDVPIDLDIIFMDEDFRVVHTQKMRSNDPSITHSMRPALYALEVNSGFNQKYKIRNGSVLRILGGENPSSTSK